MQIKVKYWGTASWEPPFGPYVGNPTICREFPTYQTLHWCHRTLEQAMIPLNNPLGPKNGIDKVAWIWQVPTDLDRDNNVDFFLATWCCKVFELRQKGDILVYANICVYRYLSHVCYVIMLFMLWERDNPHGSYCFLDNVRWLYLHLYIFLVFFFMHIIHYITNIYTESYGGRFMGRCLCKKQFSTRILHLANFITFYS